MRKATLQNSLTKGVLDPGLSERYDLAHHYNSLSDGLNMEVRPQGGIRRRPGFSLCSDADIVTGGYKRRLRRAIEPVNVTAGMITAHNGGTSANLVDQDLSTLFTTSAVTGSIFVVVEVDLGVAKPIVFLDVVGVFSSLAAKDDCLAVEWWNGSAWVEVKGGLEADLSPRRNLRPVNLKTAVACVATGGVALDGEQTIDDVTTSSSRVLVRAHNNPNNNGIWLTSSATWSRVADADSDAELKGATVYVSGGTRYGGTWWTCVTDTLDPDFSISDDPVQFDRIGGPGRTRRFGEWPGGPAGTPVSARSWRVLVKDGAGAGTVSVTGIRLWTEKRDLSPVKKISFAKARDQTFELVLGNRNIDVYRGQRYVASAPVPIAAHQVEAVTWIQSLDTLLLFHQDVATVRITRQGADDEWDADIAPYFAQPDLARGFAFSGDQDEIQEIAIPGLGAAQTYVLWLGDRVTAPITFVDTAGMAAAIEAALELLPGVDDAGVTVTLADAASRRVRVAFGGLNGARAWPALEAQVLGVDGLAAEHRTIQAGLDADGPIFGDATGFPRCGAFVQGRLLTAGYRAAPTTWGVSRVGLHYDHTATGSPLTADVAFFRVLETDQAEVIQQAFVGRNLQLFTDSSEWYGETRTLDATQPVNMVRATAEGIQPSVRVMFAEGASLFVQQGGRVLRDFVFAEAEGAYKAEPLSLLAPHLLTDVVDIGHRKARSTSEGNLIFMPNRDGSLVTLSLLKAQDVIAAVPQATDGLFRQIGADVDHEVHAVIERSTVSGGADLYLERRDETTVLDAATHYAFAVPTAALTNLGHLEGKSVWAYADRELVGPFTVTAGAVTLAVGALAVTIGLFPALSGKSPKLREKLQNERPFRPPARIHEAELVLVATGEVQIRVSGGPWRDVPLSFMDGAVLDPGQLEPNALGHGPELPLLDRLVTGSITMENLRGWSRHPTFEFRQTVPAPFELKAWRLEVAHG